MLGLELIVDMKALSTDGLITGYTVHVSTLL